MYRAMAYEWSDKPSQSEGKPLIIQIALWSFWVVKANATSPQSGLTLNGHRCPSRGSLLAISELTHFVVNSVSFQSQFA